MDNADLNLPYDSVVVGAGPVGLACAIELKRIGHRVLVVDKGALVNSLIGYPTNMEFFSTPELLEIGGHPFATRNYKPRREEALDYYRKVAQAEGLELALFEKVLGLEGAKGAFVLRTTIRQIPARFVVVATGFFDIPNRLDVPGADLDKVSHYYKEPYTFAGRRVVIVGAKNSAAKAALDCRRNGADVTMIIRGPEIGPSVKYWIRPDLLNRIEEGAIQAFFNSRLVRIDPRSVIFSTRTGDENGEGVAAGKAVEQTIANDAVLALTGYRPNYPLLRALGLSWQDDTAQTPKYDPDTFESSRPGVFLAGTVCGGLNTSRWFIENGRFHAARIAARLQDA